MHNIIEKRKCSKQYATTDQKRIELKTMQSAIKLRVVVVAMRMEAEKKIKALSESYQNLNASENNEKRCRTRKMHLRYC